MAILRVLIVEDEAPARQLLRRYLQQVDAELSIEEAPDGEIALQRLQNENWDIILLDIEMPGMDGVALMHFAKSLSSPPAIIFTTAYSEHALKAFEGGAVDYLLKPFSLERFRQAFQRAQTYLSWRGNPAPQRIAIPQKEGHLILSPSEIVGVQIEERVLEIEVRSGTTYQTRGYTLQEIEDKLPHPPFLRIGRNTLINVDAVQEVLPWFSGRYKVVMHTGKVYMCSREYAPHLLRAVGLRK
ncbi:MAG: LytTR family DNA-binding domain-containing protein [Bacteroidia bacterium]|nr:LytTR family DNA-binding domain-containing protein [Bacteroidia bacterium]MDW8236112.1 LytTR family DNA-binding domain-containing protein [Bacteroidia bacterium]